MISSDPTLPPALSDLPQTLSLQDILRHLGLDHAAANLDAASAKAIARNDSPLTLLDHLMREELRVQTERRTRAAIKRSAIFPLTTLDGFDFEFPKSIDKELVLRAAALDFIGADLLYQVFNRRYQRASTIVTTNLAFKDWGKLFQNAAAASAIADRLVHKGILIKILGKSKRSDQEVE